MTTIPNKHMAAYHEPSRKSLCVCGSGLKFKKCCAGTYSSKSYDLFQNAYNIGDYKAALIHARNSFTWYVLSYKAHTIPLLEAKLDKGENFLSMDIEALAEILHDLNLCYYHLERSDEFLNVIEYVRDIIQDSRWNAKIDFTRGLWYLTSKNDEEAAFSALKSIDLKTCQDSDILSLYLDVCPIRLTLIESVDIIDRIVDNTSKESVRLQYRALKAITYYLVCQQEVANKLFEEAISEFSCLPEEKKSSFGKLRFAHTLVTYGKAANRKDILEQGQEAVNNLIHEAEREHYAESYIADLYKLLGESEDGLGNHQDAYDAYLTSLELNSSELTRVFLARSACNNGECAETRQLLESIDDSLLDESERFDLAIVWALMAATSLVVGDISEAKTRLKAIEAHDPFFIQLRDQWMIALLEAKPKSESGKIRNLILSLNKYVILNPNLFGIGLNINRIIDDAESSPHNKDG